MSPDYRAAAPGDKRPQAGLTGVERAAQPSWMQRSAARLTIRGRVQGVGYRWWAEREARRLGLAGWVRNRSDGSVEVLAIGEAEALARLAEACKFGPSAASVETVERSDATDDGSQGFRPRPTA